MSCALKNAAGDSVGVADPSREAGDLSGRGGAGAGELGGQGQMVKGPDTPCLNQAQGLDSIGRGSAFEEPA